jgi:excinuclease UvrABC ATPase subunit
MSLFDLLTERLVDEGNTVIVIEHNLDIVKNTGWVINLGPEGVLVERRLSLKEYPLSY